MENSAQPIQPDLTYSARASALFLVVLAGYVSLARYDGLPLTYFKSQDGYVAVGSAILLLLLPVALVRYPGRQTALLFGSHRLIPIAICGALALWAGTYLLMDNYPLTRDEHMVVFDMGVFRSGRFFHVLAPAWRHYADALVPDFLLDVPGHAALVSGYLPGNAALRSIFACVADPALMNPLLTVAGGVALLQIARRSFPGKGETQAVILLLYATSAQVMVTAMTDYAMTAHLALNLVWLALFLGGSRRHHAAALAVGWVATGLHQIIFHPIFVAPFLPFLVSRGQWRTALFYAVGYVAIGLFWVSYPHIVLGLGGLSTTGDGAPSSAIGTFVHARVWPLLLHRDPAGLVLMSLNILRFFAWQNIALLPLTLLAVPAARKSEGIAKPLYYGVLLTTFAMFVLLPYQGHGWGYRYLHGVIGSFALLAGYGWERLSGERPQARVFVRSATVATCFLVLPFLLWTSHAFVRPYARVNAALDRVDVDMLVVDTEEVPFAIDEVRNPADLSARPIRLSSKALDANDLRVLCRRGTMAFVPRSAMQALGLGVSHPPTSPRFIALRASVPDNCRLRPLRLR